MNPRRQRSFLLIALALSLLVHLLVAIIVHWPSAHRREKPDIVTVSIVSLRHQRQRSVPTPAPTQKPVVALHRAPAAPKHVAPKRPGTSHRRGASRPVQPSVVASPTPQPSSSTHLCSIPNAQATLVAAPTPPAILAVLRATSVAGITSVHVSLDPQAQVLTAAIAATSGSPQLDAIAVQMARQAQYAPARLSCRAVAGVYEFSVKFVAW